MSGALGRLKEELELDQGWDVDTTFWEHACWSGRLRLRVVAEFLQTGPSRGFSTWAPRKLSQWSVLLLFFFVSPPSPGQMSIRGFYTIARGSIIRGFSTVVRPPSVSCIVVPRFLGWDLPRGHLSVRASTQGEEALLMLTWPEVHSHDDIIGIQNIPCHSWELLYASSMSNG